MTLFCSSVVLFYSTIVADACTVLAINDDGGGCGGFKLLYVFYVMRVCVYSFPLGIETQT